MRALLCLAAVVLAGIASCRPAPAGTTPAILVGTPAPDSVEPAAATPSPRSEVEQPLVAVEWGPIASTPGCFFFSGPGDLGRDDQLGAAARWLETGDRAGLAFSPGVAFRGARTDEQVSLSRRSSHDFGSKWEVDETIVGTVRSGALEARYHYTECDTRDRSACPGRCVIDAPLRFVLP